MAVMYNINNLNLLQIVYINQNSFYRMTKM